MDPDTVHDAGKTVFVGTSQMRRVTNSLGAAGGAHLNICTAGWTPTKENSFLGTDDMGFPKIPEKCLIDGKFHVVGSLQAAPTAVFERLLRDAVPILDAANTAKIVLVVPFPRYVVGKCCGDVQHITNFGTSGFWAELERPETSVNSAIVSLDYEKSLTIFNIKEVIGDTALAHMAEMEEVGTPSVWQPGDPVHFTSEVYQCPWKGTDDQRKR